MGAKATAEGGTSACVAVLTKHFVGMYEVDGGGKLAEHRALAAWIHVGTADPIMVVSPYVYCVEGLSDANLCILEHAAVALNSLSGPWVAGGDWNIEPDTFANSRWLEVD